MKIFIITFFFFVSALASAAGYSTLDSKIKGVLLLDLSINEDGFLEERFETNTNEFFRHCNGVRKLYINSHPTPIVCRSESNDGGDRIIFKSKDKRLAGMVIGSKKRLLNHIELLPILAEDIEKLGQIEITLKVKSEKEAKSEYLSSIPEASIKTYGEMLRSIKRERDFRKYSKVRYKFSTPTGNLYVSAVGLFPDIIGWNLKNYVFREVNGRIEVVGEFWGCIEGFRDLDNDGVAEILTTTCENSEGTSSSYWSLVPKVRSVVSRLG
jgi:hypothetical protein